MISISKQERSISISYPKELDDSDVIKGIVSIAIKYYISCSFGIDSYMKRYFYISDISEKDVDFVYEQITTELEKLK